MLYIVVAILVSYIVYLHLQLNKKSNLIESMVGKLTKLEKEWDTQHVLNLLEKLRQLSNDSNLKRDKLFDESVMKFMFANDSDSKIFVHYTKEESVAKKIMDDGFIFVDSFEKTVEQVISDSVDLTYKHNIRKYYGKFIIVICISNDIYNRYDQGLKELDKTNVQVEQVLTEIPSCFNDNQDEVFTLSKRFIKGYINYETGETVFNPIFNPYFSSPAFNDNLSRVKN